MLHNRAWVAVAVVVAVAGCRPPIDPEAVETCNEFLERIFGHLDDCGNDTTEARANLAEEINCENAIAVEGDPLACAAAFEEVPCAELSPESVNETIGNCDGEILVLAE